MKTTNLPCLTILFCAVVMTLTGNLHAQFQEAARWVPESANTLVMVRAEKILNSQIAQEQHWKTDRSKAFQSGAAFLPPSTKRLLMASEMDFEFWNPTWQVTIFEKSGPAISITNVAQYVGGNIETLGEKDAIILPNDSYLVKIDDNTLGAMTPANRQATARWLATRQYAVMNLSPYLTDAVNFADNNADIIIALDADYAINAGLIKKRLEESGMFKPEELGPMSEALASMKGLTLGVTINDKVTAAVKVDFKGDPSALTSSIKGMLIYALKKHGMMIDDIENWSVKANPDEKNVIIGGSLSDTGLRRMMTLIEHPLADNFAPQAAYGDSKPDMKTCTLQYFNDVGVLIKEIRKQDFQAMRTYSKYFDKYARQIDNLPVLNVDPVVLSYGSYVADSFRSISGGLDVQNLQRVQDRQEYVAGSDTYHGRGQYTNYNGYTSRYGWGGGWAFNQRNRQIVGAEANLRGANEAKDTLRQVDEATAKVRNDMSQKYQIEF
jgi:hypothetical protein